MNFSWKFVIETIDDVLRAVPITMLLTLFPMIAGLLLGFVIALARISRIPVLSQVIAVYNSFFRSIPLIVLLFITYYGTPKLINFLVYGGDRVVGSIDMNSNAIALLTLTLYASSFLSEIIRGALSSVDMRQKEAAHAVGMTGLQTYMRIIIPQAIVVAIPNYFNFFLALFKGTSVVFTISVIDMMSAAKLQAELGYRFIEAYTLVGILYVIFSFVLAGIFRKIEQKANAHIGVIV